MTTRSNAKWIKFKSVEDDVKAYAVKTRKPTYKEAWDNMSKKEQAKHGSYAAFVKAAKEYNK